MNGDDGGLRHWPRLDIDRIGTDRDAPLVPFESIPREAGMSHRVSFWVPTAFAVVAAWLGIAGPARASVTWISQDRHGASSIYEKATAFGLSQGFTDQWGGTLKPPANRIAPGFGAWSDPGSLGAVGFISNIDTVNNKVTARGSSYLASVPTIIGNLYLDYPYDTELFDTVFALSAPTDYDFTASLGGAALTGPGGQTLTFEALGGPHDYQGTLDAGQWELRTAADPSGVLQSESPIFSFSLALTPEPSAASLALVGGFIVMKRLRR
jgi:hypothetical protein